jgi:hypothetical protein
MGCCETAANVSYPSETAWRWHGKRANDAVVSGELPLNYWGDMKANYEAHNKDYTGVYKGR